MNLLAGCIFVVVHHWMLIEFFGLKQSGFLKYKIADLVMDGDIIKSARKAAFGLVAKDPHLRNQSFIELRSHFLKQYQHMLDFVNIS